MSDLVGNHIVGFPTRRLMFSDNSDSETSSRNKRALNLHVYCNLQPSD